MKNISDQHLLGCTSHSWTFLRFSKELRIWGQVISVLMVLLTHNLDTPGLIFNHKVNDEFIDKHMSDCSDDGI